MTEGLCCTNWAGVARGKTSIADKALVKQAHTKQASLQVN